MSEIKNVFLEVQRSKFAGPFRLMCFFFSSRRRNTRLQGDWSSDVCSSDLGLGGTGAIVRVPATERALRRRRLDDGAQVPAAQGRLPRVGRQPVRRQEVSGVEGGLQIGRGSCRERGKISVVAVSLKKKSQES